MILGSHKLGFAYQDLAIRRVEESLGLERCLRLILLLSLLAIIDRSKVMLTQTKDRRQGRPSFQLPLHQAVAIISCLVARCKLVREHRMDA